MISNNKLRLFIAGIAMLFWELVLIRWQSNSLRVVAYYTNFVLIAAFFGLGFGSLLARFQVRLWRFLPLAILISLTSAVWLGGYFHINPRDFTEYVWLGAPIGVNLAAKMAGQLPFWMVMVIVYSLTALVFLLFGQWIGTLFKQMPALKAYSIEVSGSLVGIGLFGLLAYLSTSPIVWVSIGFVLLLLITERSWWDHALLVGAAVVALLIISPITSQFYWSPYYKIRFDPIRNIAGMGAQEAVHFDSAKGYSLTVNNDYHQMLLDLRPHNDESAFFKDWRRLYDAPYSLDKELPEGPILVVGAGTGNDVMAALRNTKREVYAVEIDPVILKLGKEFHFEKPYQNPRVHPVLDDARSFFQTTKTKFALVVFGFLDSHTLLSSFTSLRLDNFVYTENAFAQVKQLLAPGGEVVVTFAVNANAQWIHQRMAGLLGQVFDSDPEFMSTSPSYANGNLYRAFKDPIPAGVPKKKAVTSNVLLPTDDWPFLYLQSPKIPAHYQFFILLVLVLGLLPLFFLPKGQRSIRFPYFFMGASFFLLETSNVVSLSLLYGSTWVVNVIVFAGILILILAGNTVAGKVRKISLPPAFGVLAILIGIAYLVSPSALLAIQSGLIKAIAAVSVFLSPVFVASLIFAQLIREEQNLYQAYGSNLLGAVVGGASEYFSLMFGFKFLLAMTLFGYLIALIVLLWTSRTGGLKAPAR